MTKARQIATASLIGMMVLSIGWSALQGVTGTKGIYCGHVLSVAIRGPVSSGGELNQESSPDWKLDCTGAARRSLLLNTSFGLACGLLIAIGINGLTGSRRRQKRR